MTEIPKHILALQKIEGFTKVWCERTAFHKTYEQAYDSVEQLYISYFGERKYASYESFVICRNRYYKKSVEK